MASTKKKSTRKQGALYLAKTKKYFLDLGYKVEKLEVNIPFWISGKAIFSRKDLLGSDLAVWTKDEFFLVQVKSTSADTKDGVSKHKSEAKLNFEAVGLPDFIKKKIFIWIPRQKPIIYDL